jgi:hypothetical protein
MDTYVNIIINKRKVKMNKGVVALALACLAITIVSQTTGPQPGSLFISTNLKYLNNIFGLVFPITMQQMLQK